MKKLFLIVSLIIAGDLWSQADTKTIMAVFAHPDDEAVTNVSALLSHYAAKGHTVYLVIATKGELGTNPHAGIPAGDSLAHVRAREAACATRILGIEPIILLGLGDGALAKHFTGAPLRMKLDSVFSKYRPDVIITWGPEGGYGHMDHRTVHNVVTELFQAGKTKTGTKLFYSGMPLSIFNEKRKDGPFNMWMLNEWKPVKMEYLTYRIPVSNTDLEKALEAFECHWSQFTRDEFIEGKKWMQLTGSIVYLRPFKTDGHIHNNLFQ